MLHSHTFTTILINILFLIFLTGTIPTFFGLPSMKRVELEGNLFTGPIPSELGLWEPPESLRLQESIKMKLFENMLTGALPSELGRLQHLIDLSVHSNKLTGNIPTELGLLGELGVLSLGKNSFTGTLPSEIGYLATNGSLKELDVSGTLLVGTLPAQLCILNASLVFDCAHNKSDAANEGLCGCDCPCPPDVTNATLLRRRG